jgi:hypothetical protein
MWNSILLVTVAITAGLILLAYIVAEAAYRTHDQSRQHSQQQSGE